MLRTGVWFSVALHERSKLKVKSRGSAGEAEIPRDCGAEDARVAGGVRRQRIAGRARIVRGLVADGLRVAQRDAELRERVRYTQSTAKSEHPFEQSAEGLAMQVERARNNRQALLDCGMVMREDVGQQH